MAVLGADISLQQWLTTRKLELEKVRAPFEILWRTIRKTYEPSLGHSLAGDVSHGENALRDDELIANSRPRNFLHRLAAGLQSGITNQSRQWFRLQSVDAKLEKSRLVREYLDRATETVQKSLNRSNIYPALDQVYLRLGQFGTSASLLVPDEETEIRLIVCDEGSYWIAEDRRKRVDTLLRRIVMPLSQLKEEFGVSALPRNVVEDLNAGLFEKEITIYNLIFPRSQKPDLKGIREDRLFASVYWVDGFDRDKAQSGEHGILAIRGFDYNPIIAPRWASYTSSPYGIGPAQIGLGDALELQKLEKAALKIVEMESNPPLAVPASMREEGIDAGPGGTTFYPDIQGGKIPVGRLFETRQSLEAVQVKISEVENRLSQTFYTDLFAMMLNLNMAPKQMTAREVSELSSEKIALLGPILTRMNADLLDPLVDGVWAILFAKSLEAKANGEFDDSGLSEVPGVLEGTEIRFEYVSSLHVEQQSATRLSEIYKIADMVAAFAQIDPAIVDAVDTDKVMEVTAQSIFDHGIIRDKKDIEKIREGRAAAQQQQVQMQQDAAAARAIKDLAAAKMQDGTSALEALGTRGAEQAI